MLSTHAIEVATRKWLHTPASKRPALLAKCREIVASPVCDASARYAAEAILAIAE